MLTTGNIPFSQTSSKPLWIPLQVILNLFHSWNMVQGELFSDDVTEVNPEKVDTDGIK